MKIHTEDLEFFDITNVNAISILNAGLAFFTENEEVYKADREYTRKRQRRLK